MVLAVSLLMYQRASNIIRHQTSSAHINNLTNIANNIDIVLESLDILGANANLNNDLKTWMTQSPTTDIHAWYITNQNIIRYLYSLSLYHAAVESVYAYSMENGFIFGTGMTRTVSIGDICESQWQSFFCTAGPKRWHHAKNIFELDFKNNNLISTPVDIKNRSMTRTIGVISINIDERYLRRYFEDITFGTTGTVYITDETGMIISHNNPQKIGSQSAVWDELSLQSDKSGSFSHKSFSDTIFLYASSAYTGWKYVGEITVDEINASIISIRDFTIMMSVIALLIATALSFAVSRTIIVPIRKLSCYMERAGKGDLNIHKESPRTDEFGILFDSFNSMVRNSRKLIDELYIQKLIKKDVHLKMVQSQISSHFLYNTLDAIYWTARENQYDEVSSMTKNLSMYLKKSLSEGKEIITISEIAELLSSYVAIQNIRHDSKFTVLFNFDPGVMHCKVLKFLFQPLVENAIIHGGNTLAESQKITITAKPSEAGSLLFQVTDDGKGIEKRKLSEIQKALSEQYYQAEGSFALKNINAMIKLFYGRAYGLSIHSILGEGTEVSIIVPMKD